MVQLILTLKLENLFENYNSRHTLISDEFQYPSLSKVTECTTCTEVSGKVI
jgi:hypothetical protein